MGLPQTPTPTESGSDASTIRDLLDFGRSHALSAFVASLLGFALLAAYAFTRVPEYQSEARLVVHQDGVGSLGELSALAALSASTPSAVEIALLSSRTIALEVLRESEGPRPTTPDDESYHLNMGLQTTTRDASLTPFELLKRRFVGPRQLERPSAHPLARLHASAERVTDQAPTSVRVHYIDASRVRISKPTFRSRFGLGRDRDPEEFAFEPGVPVEYRGLRLWLHPTGAFEGQSFFVRYQPRFKALRDLTRRTSVREVPASSGILGVFVRDSDPNRAAETANAICENFLEVRSRRITDRSAATSGFLKDLLEEHEADARTTRNRLSELKAENPNLVHPEGSAQSFLQQITALEQQRAQLGLKRNALSKTIRDLDEGNPHAISRLDAATVSTGLNVGKTTEELLGRISEVRAATARISATRSSEHADVANGEKTIKKLETRVLEELRSRLAGFDSQLAAIDGESGELKSGLTSMPSEQHEMIELLGRLSAQEEITPYLARALQAADLKDVSAQKQVEFVDRAVPPDVVHSPSVLYMLLAGLVAGAVVGVLTSTFFDIIRTPRPSARIAELPLLAELPPTRSKRGRHWVPLRDHPNGAMASALRQVRASIGPDLAGTWGVTSAGPGEGRSLVALALAQSLAATDRRVLLIGADETAKGSPPLAELAGVPNAPSFAAVLAEADGARTPPSASTTSGLDVYDGGAQHAADPYASRGTAAFLGELRDRYDCIVVDLAAVLDTSDACTLAARLDSTLFVHRARKCAANRADAALEQLRAASVSLCGVVRNSG